MTLSKKQITKALISLSLCSLLTPKDRFSRVEAHVNMAYVNLKGSFSKMLLSIVTGVRDFLTFLKSRRVAC